MYFFRRMRFLGSVIITWSAALLAIYTHPAFWVLFGVVLCVLVIKGVRSRHEESSNMVDPGQKDTSVHYPESREA